MKLIQLLVLFLFATIVQAQTEPRLVLPIGHTSPIKSAVFSPDGKYIVTSSNDNTAKIWECETGKLINTLIHRAEVNHAVFSPDGKLILTSCNDNAAHLYSANSDEEFHEFDWWHHDDVLFAQFSPDGKRVVTASYDNTIRVWDYPSDKSNIILEGHKDFVVSAVFSPDGNTIISSSNDKTARIWDAFSGALLHTLTDSLNGIKSAIYSSDGRLILTTSFENTAALWNSLNGELILQFNGHKDKIKSAVFSPSGSMIITASNDQTSCIWDSKNGQLLNTLKVDTSSIIKSATFSRDEKFILISLLNHIIVYDLSTYKESSIIPGLFTGFSLDGQKVLTTGISASLSGNKKWTTQFNDEYNFFVWEIKSGSLLQSFETSTKSLSTVNLEDNSQTIFSNSIDSTFHWDFKSGKPTICSHTLMGYDYCLQNYLNLSTERSSEMGLIKVTSPDGKYFLEVEDSESIVRVYESNKNALYQTLVGHEKRIISAIFSQDSKIILTTSYDNTARIWDVASGKLLHTLNHYYKDAINSAVFSPDEKSILTSGADHMALLWNVITGEEYATLDAHTDEVVSAVFDSSGQYIITTGEDNKTIIWNAKPEFGYDYEPLYTRLQIKDYDWLVYDEHYRFDGSPGAIEKLYFVCGLEVIELGQMKDALYVPDLASKILNGEDINYQKLSDLPLCDALPLIEKTNETENKWEFIIEQRRWPIVRLEVLVDGKTVKTISADNLKFIKSKANLELTRFDMQKYLKVGEKNKVTVIAITQFEKNEFKSRGEVIELEAEGEKTAPSLYMLMIGVNDYKDDALDLRFPVKDAQAFSAALESSAQKLLGADKVFVYNVQSKNDNSVVYTTPERAGVMKALQEIGSKAKTNDVLFIFFAGHGVMQGADNTFTFLTADASKINPVGISTADLKSWLSPEGPFHMMPNKTVLVYDACNSGQAAKEMMADLALARDDDATERQRQIEDLGDKQGVFILSASAPNQSAYELPHLGQGMLTYSLLSTLKNNPSVLDEDQNGKGFLNLQKWFLETEREQSRLMQSLGLKQEAQPYGTANIRIGLVDDEVRNGISLMAEKPLVYCSNARNDSDEDPLNLKEAVNSYLETAMTRGTTSKLGYIKAETSQANILKLVYSVNGDKIQCRILVFKNKVKVNELIISTSASKAAWDIVNAVEGLFK